MIWNRRILVKICLQRAAIKFSKTLLVMQFIWRCHLPVFSKEPVSFHSKNLVTRIIPPYLCDVNEIITLQACTCLQFLMFIPHDVCLEASWASPCWLAWLEFLCASLQVLSCWSATSPQSVVTSSWPLHQTGRRGMDWGLFLLGILLSSSLWKFRHLLKISNGKIR